MDKPPPDTPSHEALARVRDARVGRLATVRPDGTPHVIPVVFVLTREGDTTRLYWAVDQKPKATTEIRRLRNIRANPAVEVVVDSYAEDWDEVWWVRLTGMARVVEDASEREAALAALADKYPQYAASPPEGAVVAIEVQRLSAWQASPETPRYS